MKFTAVLTFVAAVTVVSASSNAERMARGLGPKSPVKRGSPVDGAHHSKPSGTPSHCNTGEVHCCNSVQKAHSGDKCDDILKILGIFGDVRPGTPVGVTCSPITGASVAGGGQCKQQTVCCENNHYHGLINIGCVPINL